jgi:RNA polymerase sigma-70 factor (ECF subfamily)
MQDQERLAERFEEHRPHLRAVAYRMLGSLSDADDAVQEAWLRLSRSGDSGVENLGGWLTTVVARLCLNMLHACKTRREEPLEVLVPEPILSPVTGGDPEQEALLTDSVGLALQVVLVTLAPAERLAFVLHDMFAVPFDEIAPMVGRSPTAARQLASRARRRVQIAANVPDRDLGRQWQVVDAFMDAARNRDFAALVAVLDPNVVLRADTGTLRGAAASRVLRGARAAARGAVFFSPRPAPDRVMRRSLVNGAAGVVVFEQGRLVSVIGFTVAGGRIVEVDVLSDPERLARLDLAGLDS